MLTGPDPLGANAWKLDFRICRWFGGFFCYIGFVGLIASFSFVSWKLGFVLAIVHFLGFIYMFKRAIKSRQENENRILLFCAIFPIQVALLGLFLPFAVIAPASDGRVHNYQNAFRVDLENQLPHNSSLKLMRWASPELVLDNDTTILSDERPYSSYAVLDGFTYFSTQEGLFCTNGSVVEKVFNEPMKNSLASPICSHLIPLHDKLICDEQLFGPTEIFSVKGLNALPILKDEKNHFSSPIVSDGYIWFKSQSFVYVSDGTSDGSGRSVDIFNIDKNSYSIPIREDGNAISNGYWKIPRFSKEIAAIMVKRLIGCVFLSAVPALLSAYAMYRLFSKPVTILPIFYFGLLYLCLLIFNAASLYKTQHGNSFTFSKYFLFAEGFIGILLSFFLRKRGRNFSISHFECLFSLSLWTFWVSSLFALDLFVRLVVWNWVLYALVLAFIFAVGVISDKIQAYFVFGLGCLTFAVYMVFLIFDSSLRHDVGPIISYSLVLTCVGVSIWISSTKLRHPFESLYKSLRALPRVGYQDLVETSIYSSDQDVNLKRSIEFATFRIGSIQKEQDPPLLSPSPTDKSPRHDLNLHHQQQQQ